MLHWHPSVVQCNTARVQHCHYQLSLVVAAVCQDLRQCPTLLPRHVSTNTSTPTITNVNWTFYQNQCKLLHSMKFPNESLTSGVAWVISTGVDCNFATPKSCEMPDAPLLPPLLPLSPQFCHPLLIATRGGLALPLLPLLHHCTWKWYRMHHTDCALNTFDTHQ